MKHTMLYRNKGFTLIELLVVLTIIAVLAGLLFTSIKIALKVIGGLALIAGLAFFVWQFLKKKPN